MTPHIRAIAADKINRGGFCLGLDPKKGNVDAIRNLPATL